MDFYKQFFMILFEMCLSIFIAIFSYALWDNFDKTKYLELKKYNNLKEVEVYYEGNKLVMHNVSKSNNNKNLILRVNKNEYVVDNTKLLINGNEFDLSEFKNSTDDNFIYYVIDNVNFNKYETKVYDVDILSNDNNYVVDELNYLFITEV